MSKCGYVTIFGKANAGKSTLTNKLLNYNLSIVNKKAQTTRNRILGILTEDDYQIIFQDTPGILEPKYELQNFMIREIKSALTDSDLIIHILDITNINYDELKEFEKKFKDFFQDKKRIIVLNKIDLVQKEEVVTIIKKLSDKLGYEDIVPISAEKNFNTDELKKVIVKYLPESSFYYDENILTDKPEKFFVSEIIRGKILEMFHDEIPYSVYVNIAEFKERDRGKDYINAEIVLERESQKIILIGKGGNMLKKLGANARAEIEKFLGREVYLELFVKVRKDWRRSKDFLKEKFKK